MKATTDRRRFPHRRLQDACRRSWRTRKLRLEALEERTLLAFTVINTSDSGAGSLRQAILDANAAGGADIIDFNIPTTDPNFVDASGVDCDLLNDNVPDTTPCWWVIKLGPLGLPGTGTDLPLITEQVHIDGFTQTTNKGDTNPGMVGTGGTVGVDAIALPQYQRPEVAIDANSAVNPLHITDGSVATSNVIIEGLAIYDAGDLISGDGNVAITSSATGTGNTVRKMLVGTLPDATRPGGVLFSSVVVCNNTSASECNKGFGVRALSPAELTITENFVGFNGRGGIDGEANATVVHVTYNEVFESGWNSGDHDGIDMNGVNSDARYNLSHKNTNNTCVLGGLVTCIATGGSGNGLEIGSQSNSGPAFDNNIAENNTLKDNLSSGISIRKREGGNTIRKNIVTENDHVGISINREDTDSTASPSPDDPTNRNQLTENSTFMNMGVPGLGIDLQGPAEPAAGSQWVGDPDGVTANDGGTADDADTGSNDLQNWPTLTSATVTGNSTTISGSLDSTPNTNFTIEFFATPDGISFGAGDREGKTFLCASPLTTDGSGMASFTVTCTGPTVSTGDNITATATVVSFVGSPPAGTAVDNTSEYSNPVQVQELAGQKVTGGGFFQSTAAADCNSPCVGDGSGRANYGFNAKYLQGSITPQGHTNFVHRGAGLHFGSTSYETLSLKVDVSTGEAEWRGEGKLNQEKNPTHCFQTWVDDNGEPGSSDEFRIKIWKKTGGDCSNESNVVYDNNPAGAPDPGTNTGTTIGGGNIQLHVNLNVLADVSAPSATSEALNAQQLQPIVAEAIARWQQAGLDDASLQALAGLPIQIADLPGSILGQASPGMIVIDEDAAGYGWFVDTTASDSSEFHAAGHDSELAFVNSSAAGRVDLLTAVTHELGHQLGFDHSHEHDTMHATLAPSMRLLPELEHHEPVPVSFVTSFNVSQLSNSHGQAYLFSFATQSVPLAFDWSIKRSATPTALDRLFGQTVNWRHSRLIGTNEREADLLGTPREGIVDRITSWSLHAAPAKEDSQDSADLSSDKLLADELEQREHEKLVPDQLLIDLLADVQKQLRPRLPDDESEARDPQQAAPVETTEGSDQATEQEAEEVRPDDAPTDVILNESEVEQLMDELTYGHEDEAATVDAVYAELAE